MKNQLNLLDVKELGLHIKYNKKTKPKTQNPKIKKYKNKIFYYLKDIDIMVK